MKKSSIERWAEIILFIIFFYLFAVKCTTKKIDARRYPHYPYVIEKVK